MYFKESFDKEKIEKQHEELLNIFKEDLSNLSDKEEAKRLQKKIAKNQYDFNDFLSQIAQIKKMGNLKDLASMIPGVME